MNFDKTHVINIAKIIYEKTHVELDIDNNDLVDIIKDIANAVYSAEVKRNTKSQIINEIITNEILEYIIPRIDTYASKPQDVDEMISKGLIGDNNEILEEIIPEIERKYTMINLSTNFNSHHINNVSSVKLIELCIPNMDYIINERNNTLSFVEHLNGIGEKELFSEKRTIVIEPGNYTPEQIISELSYNVNAVTSNTLYFYFDAITSKICITSMPVSETLSSSKLKMLQSDDHKNFNVLQESTILKVLGFNGMNVSNKNKYIGDYPLILEKTKIIQMCITIGDLELKDFIISKDGEYFHKAYSNDNVSHLNNEDINDIIVNFGDYNTRGCDFNIIIEIESS